MHQRMFSSTARASHLRSIGGVIAMVALVTACSSAGTAPTTSASAVASVAPAASPSAPASAMASAATGPVTVQVKLQEFAVLPSVPSVRAGLVTFMVQNSGPDDVHEMVVLKTDLAAGALPVDKDGKVKEGVAGVTNIGEVEEVAVGQTKPLELTLAPGKYVLICNVLQTEPDGSLEAHYKVGMRTAFEVTAP